MRSASGHGASCRSHQSHRRQYDRATALAVAEAVHERYGWPLHVIKHCADDPPMEQPDAFVRALRPALDTQSHSYSKESPHEYNDKPSSRRDMRSSDCGRDDPFDSRRQPGSRGLKGALGAVLVATVLLCGANRRAIRCCHRLERHQGADGRAGCPSGCHQRHRPSRRVPHDQRPRRLRRVRRRHHRGPLEPAGPGQRVRGRPGDDRPVSERARLDHDVPGDARCAQRDRAKVSAVRVLRHRPVRSSDRRRGAGCP